MFGSDSSSQTVMGSPAVQNPSMLDNVSQQDFQATDNVTATAPAASVIPPAPAPATQPADASVPPPPSPAPADPVAPAVPVEHPLTTDNPFAQDPLTTQTVPAPDSTSPSGPIEPPTVSPVADDAATDAQAGYISAITDDASTTPPVDHDKLADMKQEALAHLEPLADHIDGTPEEVFRTTMQMIQANDNHTLLEKALEAAKNIEDDKARAQAMLDIINEINYFSQGT